MSALVCHKPTVVGESIVRPISTGFDPELQKRMFDLEMMKFEEDRKEREARRRREDEEREERRRKEEAERELRLREIKIREDELARQTRRDTNEAEKRQSLAARTKFFSEAMKNVFWKFPNDPAEIPGYFEHIENLFSLYEVDDDVKSKLLQAHLNDRAKTLTVRLSRDQLDNYDALKDFLLNEFKISPIQLRERFFSLRKKQDETYTLLSSKLRNALMYYLRSRNITNEFDKVVSLSAPID